MKDFWKKQHDVIATMSEWERGWYHAAISTLWWNTEGQAEDLEDGEVVRARLCVDSFDGKWVVARYSPSGSQRHAEHFYSPEPPPADDLVEILFDEDKFRAVWVELDSEAALCYYRIEYHLGKFMDEIYVVHGCTESDAGIPSSWDSWPEAGKPTVINHKDEVA